MPSLRTPVVGAFTVVLALCAANANSLSTTISLGSVALASFAVILLMNLTPGSPSWGLADFRLGSWMLLFGSVAFGLATISLNGYQEGVAALVDRELAPRALVLVGFGYLTFFVGYRFGPARPLARGVQRLLQLRPIGRRGEPRPWAVLVAAYGLGLGATLLKIKLEGGYGYIGGSNLSVSSAVPSYDQPLTILSFLRTAALFAVTARAVALPRQRGGKVLLILMFLAEVLIGLLSGVKESFVVALLAVLIPYVLIKKRKIPWARLLAAAAIFILIVTPFVTSLRSTVRTGDQRLSAATSIQIGLQSLLSGKFYTTTDGTNPMQQVVARVREIDNVVVIIDKTPDLYPYRPLSQLMLAPVTAVVPRAIWPSKPLRLSGLEFYKTYYQGQSAQSSSAITFQGSLFMHGGTVILLLGMLAYGWLVRGLDDGAQLLDPPTGGLFALSAFVPIVKQEMDAPTLLATLPVIVVTYMVSVLLVMRRKSPADRMPPTVP